MQNPSEAELGYAAGILDGEGCISIYAKTLYSNRHVRRTRTKHLTLTLAVTNTCEDAIKWLQARFGGQVTCRTYTNHFKPLWIWNQHGAPAAAFLHQVEPYMIVKREEAQAALLFAETINWPLVNTGKVGGRILSDETLRIRELCYRHLHALKSKGRRPKLSQTRKDGLALRIA